MRNHLWMFFLVLLISLVGVYAYKHLGDEQASDNVIHYQTGEFRVLDIPLKQIDYSPIVSAIIYSHLKEGTLQLSFKCMILSDKPLDDNLICRMESDGQKICVPLTLSPSRANEGHFVTDACFQYNLSELLKQGRTEDDVMSFLKSLQKEPKDYIHFIGKIEDDQEYSI